MTNVLAIDLGATSGRAIIGTYEAGGVHLTEISRFKDYVMKSENTWFWNLDEIMRQIKQAIIKANDYDGVDSIAVNTWGVDFGLIDAEGKLIRQPIHYRDERTKDMLEVAADYMPLEQIYKETGIQLMEINTLYQLLYVKINEPEIYKRVDKVLMMPDLINYLLTGIMLSERSIASTTQLYNPMKKQWSEEIIESFSFERHFFTDLIDAGQVIGKLKPEFTSEETQSIQVVSIASHDTASAVFSVPSDDEAFTFISSGTWSLIGQELDYPIINDQAFSNEIGVKDKVTFLRNLTGLWILEQCKAEYKRKGYDYSYSEIMQLTNETTETTGYIDVNDAVFSTSGDMIDRINDYLLLTGQKKIQTPGEVFKLIYTSLAMKYREVQEQLESITNIKSNKVYIVGGGAKSDLLCQLTANISNKVVVAGPSEATATGNISMQLVGLNHFEDTREAKQLLRTIGDVKEYLPIETDNWETAYQHYASIINR
ncbi:rhamnulokinase/L-fuculokinase [Natronobacillus azotifigens]|uniref:Rhamnulokinase n=1 Tax=Natronobacillus azotifigens TaxID=472978 RepID=A0A9J6RCE6_9BACI|nr:rhamnulokinase family protein [Natronobacillus azotifigens]MCZ0703030.1 rhamnulokinase [Natronobacillus azotifigens]